MLAHLERAQLLLQQQRFAPAEQELRSALVQDPDDPFAHAMLAMCLSEQKRSDEALDEARQAVHQGPDVAFTHYVMAAVRLERHEHREARAAIEQALAIKPDEPTYWAILGSIHSTQGDWKAMLDAANRGMAVNAEDVDCANLRAMALVRLNRRDEADETLAATLAREPDNALAHANSGWQLLHRNQPRQAMEHFREALRLDPQNDWARQGIVEALKAHNLIYRVMLAYFLWMSRLSPRVQFGLIFGAYFGYRILASAAQKNPKLEPYVMPVLIAYMIFVALTWIADPLFNVLLRLSRFGRYALSDDQRACSNWVALLLLIALASGVTYFAVPALSGLALILGVSCVAYVLPVNVRYSQSFPPMRRKMTWYLAGVAALWLGALAAMLSGHPASSMLILAYIWSCWGSAIVPRFLRN